jgi:hypothetical protein
MIMIECNDVWTVIFQYLDIRSLLRTASLNQMMYNLFNDNRTKESSWSELIERDFNEIISATRLPSSQQQYKHLYSLFHFRNSSNNKYFLSDRKEKEILIVGYKTEYIHLANMLLSGKWESVPEEVNKFKYQIIDRFNLKFRCYPVGALSRGCITYFSAFRTTIVVLDTSHPKSKKNLSSSLDCARLIIQQYSSYKRQCQDTPSPLLLVLIEEKQSTHEAFVDVKQLCSDNTIDIIKVKQTNAPKSLVSILAFVTNNTRARFVKVKGKFILV